MRLGEGIHPYYVTGYLNSMAGKMLTSQIATGQINPFLGLGNLRTIPIPIFSTEQMNQWGTEIERTIKDAEAKRQTSAQLLEIAKRAVEIAIENNEDTAIAWIDQELERLGVTLETPHA